MLKKVCCIIINLNIYLNKYIKKTKTFISLIFTLPLSFTFPVFPVRRCVQEKRNSKKRNPQVNKALRFSVFSPTEPISCRLSVINGALGIIWRTCADPLFIFSRVLFFVQPEYAAVRAA